jgi:4-amino-4-deoxy-L-arabinose transferase-like glycosyltransferase
MSIPSSSLSLPSLDERRLRWGLIAVALLFLAWRVPVMYRDPGGQDEAFYAVPGLTILEDGLPRMPHLPARNLDSAFYKSDIMLYAEPPLYFYYQAAFYALLPDQWGTARLSTAIAGVALLVLMARLARRLGLGVSAALWGAGLFSVSRWYFFTAIAARPDILCTAFGVAALLATLSWQETKRVRWLFSAGVLIGLGGLTHPFALVYAVQIAVWIGLTTTGRERATKPALVAATAIAVASVWGLLIMRHPDIFRIQFRNQFLSGEGPPLWLRLLWPWEAIAYHAAKLWERAGAWQFLLALTGWLACGLLGRREQFPRLMTLWWLAGTGAWLLAGLVGTHHPVYGYWTYPAALAFLGLGEAVARLLAALRNSIAHVGFRRVAGAATALFLIATMVPGCGLRTLITHVRHWNDINYCAPRFAQALLDTIPPEARCIVDEEFSLEFVVAGRRIIMAQIDPLYLRADEYPCDYLLVSRHGRQVKIVEAIPTRLLETRGRIDDLFSCYVEIRVPANGE